MPHRTPFLLALLLLALLLLGGCAVLHIDVDVYKGPLANHEDVQVEQVAVMAVGARPLLIQLRDRLQVGPGNDGALEALKSHPRYVSGHIPPETSLPYQERLLKNEDALKVNAILGRYENRTDSPAEDLILAARTAFHRYEDHQPMVNGSALISVEEAADLAQRMREAPLWPKSLTPEVRARALPFWKDLKTAYAMKFLPPQGPNRFRHVAAVLAAHTDLVGALGSDAAACGLGRLALEGHPVAHADLKRLGSNARFEILESDRCVEAHAALLFDDATAAHHFTGSVRGIAAAFRISRESLEELWLAAMLYLRDFDGAENRRFAAGIAAGLTHRRFLGDAANRHGNESRLRSSRHSPQEFATTSRQEIKDSLILDKDAASTLLELNRYTKEFAAERSPLGSLQESIDHIRVRYGIVAGPVADGATVLTGSADGTLSSTDESTIAEALSGLGGLLSRGRLDDGLFVLIENYLEARHGGSADAVVAEHRSALFDALIRFSRSVRTIAGFHQFLGEDPEEVRNYIDLLEAVANSIETEVNSLMNRDSHMARLRNRAGSEVESLQQAVTQLNDKANSNSVPGRLSQTVSPGQDSRQTLDQLISALHYRLVEVVEQHGADSREASQLRAAIDVAEEHRSGMVFIQPASAYLKNSYPASSLQRDSIGNWRNLLDQHALRQLPLVGGLAENGRRAKARETIDKQFWHNVNRVRVAGAGSTNYVLAKDDIGNWYVKNYASDPNEIIKGAKGLALYAARGAISADALKESSDTLRGEGDDDEGEEPRESGEGPVVARVVEQTTAQAEATAATAATAFRTGVTRLPDAIRRTWNDTVSGSDKLKNLEALSLALELAGPPRLAAAEGSADRIIATATTAALSWSEALKPWIDVNKIKEELTFRRALASIEWHDQSTRRDRERDREKARLEALKQDLGTPTAGSPEEARLASVNQRLGDFPGNFESTEAIENLIKEAREDGLSEAQLAGLREALAAQAVLEQLRLDDATRNPDGIMARAEAVTHRDLVLKYRGDPAGAMDAPVSAWRRTENVKLPDINSFTDRQKDAARTIRSFLIRGLEARKSQILEVEKRLDVIGEALQLPAGGS